MSWDSGPISRRIPQHNTLASRANDMTRASTHIAKDSRRSRAVRPIASPSTSTNPSGAPAWFTKPTTTTTNSESRVCTSSHAITTRSHLPQAIQKSGGVENPNRVTNSAAPGKGHALIMQMPGSPTNRASISLESNRINRARSNPPSSPSQLETCGQKRFQPDAEGRAFTGVNRPVSSADCGGLHRTYRVP